MNEFEFELGAIVVIDPTGGERGPKGQVIGHIRNIDGSVGYLVSCVDFGRSGITRHHVSACEIHRAEENHKGKHTGGQSGGQRRR